jgi:uncharacterized protein (TIGR02246 family)
VIDDIQALMAAWLRAVRDRDVEALGEMVTDDVLVIHPNGRSTAGRDALKADYARFFATHTAEQTVTSEETIISGNWAFDRATMHTTMTPVGGGDTREVDSRTLTILHRDESERWRVARVIAVIAA